jgi:hypothetical protein
LKSKSGSLVEASPVKNRRKPHDKPITDSLRKGDKLIFRLPSLAKN